MRSRWLDIGQVIIFFRSLGPGSAVGVVVVEKKKLASEAISAGNWGREGVAEFVSFHKHAKKERGQYPAILTEQAWSINDLLYGIKHQRMIFDLAGPKPEIPSGQGSSILPAHGASQIIGYITNQIFVVLALAEKTPLS